MNRIVGIGEMIVSNHIEDTIKTFALASCVGVTAYSSAKKVGGVLHIALPRPINSWEGKVRCCYYASTGIPFFINTMCKEYGCIKEELCIQLYGGADTISKNDVFHIGRKNIEITPKILARMNLCVNYAEVGERVSRTIELDVNTGLVNVWRQDMII